MAALATQIACTVPLGLLVALAATGYRTDWFFPASSFLYGMILFAVLAGCLVFGCVILALWIPEPFGTRGWLTGLVLLVFAFLFRAAAEIAEQAPATTRLPPS
jgi:hypothetical protein